MSLVTHKSPRSACAPRQALGNPHDDDDNDDGDDDDDDEARLRKKKRVRAFGRISQSPQREEKCQL